MITLVRIEEKCSSFHKRQKMQKKFCMYLFLNAMHVKVSLILWKIKWESIHNVLTYFFVLLGDFNENDKCISTFWIKATFSHLYRYEKKSMSPVSLAYIIARPDNCPPLELLLENGCYPSQWITDYLSLWPKPDFFNLWLRLRPPNFISENFHLSRRFKQNVFFH